MQPKPEPHPPHPREKDNKHAHPRKNRQQRNPYSPEGRTPHAAKENDRNQGHRSPEATIRPCNQDHNTTPINGMQTHQQTVRTRPNADSANPQRLNNRLDSTHIHAERRESPQPTHRKTKTNQGKPQTARCQTRPIPPQEQKTTCRHHHEKTSAQQTQAQKRKRTKQTNETQRRNANDANNSAAMITQPHCNNPHRRPRPTNGKAHNPTQPSPTARPTSSSGAPAEPSTPKRTASTASSNKPTNNNKATRTSCR
ncbi:hypothetical protein AZ036_004407 [Klebsiella michiganensis]|nr:hypothetical protein AZ036_004407 [Klebsiella michiganensis]